MIFTATAGRGHALMVLMMRVQPDLFGEIPVTWADVLAWMLAVPGIPPTTRRFGYYVRGWHVIEKIQASKEAGTFEAIVSAPAAPPPFRLAAMIDAANRARTLRL